DIDVIDLIIVAAGCVRHRDEAGGDGDRRGSFDPGLRAGRRDVVDQDAVDVDLVDAVGLARVAGNYVHAGSAVGNGDLPGGVGVTQLLHLAERVIAHVRREGAVPVDGVAGVVLIPAETQ